MGVQMDVMTSTLDSHAGEASRAGPGLQCGTVRPKCMMDAQMVEPKMREQGPPRTRWSEPEAFARLMSDHHLDPQA